MKNAYKIIVQILNALYQVIIDFEIIQDPKDKRARCL